MKHSLILSIHVLLIDTLLSYSLAPFSFGALAALTEPNFLEVLSLLEGKYYVSSTNKLKNVNTSLSNTIPLYFSYTIPYQF